MVLLYMTKMFILILIPVILYGCAGKLMEKTTVDYDMKLEKGKSAIIFIRTFGQYSGPIVEYKNGNVSFVGNSTGGSILMHVTDAGKHLYIIAAGKGTILKTDLKSGMFYYVYILPGSKNGRAILYPEPYEPDKNKSVVLSSEFTKNINEFSVRTDSKNIMWQKNTLEGFAWFDNNAESFISKYKYALRTKNIYELDSDIGVSELIK